MSAASEGASPPGRGSSWIYGLMGVMLLSGTANTLLMKFQVRTPVAAGPALPASGFAHPVTQTLFMLLGETMCLLVFYGRPRAPGMKVTDDEGGGFPKFIMALPAVCDLLASTLVHTAYIFIPASIAQMCRGSIVIFACAFSVAFLGKRQHRFQYVGVSLVAAGILVVAIAAHGRSSGSGSTATSSGGMALVGVLLCLGAQIFQASQLVVEEKFLSKYTIPPLQAVGLEGLFGSIIVIIALCILNPLGVENTRAALYQMQHSATLTAAIIVAICSIGLFNWAGISITKHSSCVARATIDGSRTIFIWIIELALGWNSFHILQLIGFILVALGTLLYNRILELRSVFSYPDASEEKPLADKKEEAVA